METVTASPKFQAVILRVIGEILGLQPGQKIRAILYENRIELIPPGRAQEMCGFLKGVATSVEIDSTIIATAGKYNAGLWTQAGEFRGLKGVRKPGRAGCVPSKKDGPAGVS